MPCSDDRSGGDPEVYARLQAATRAACEMAAALGKEKLLDLSLDTIRWVNEHEEMDRQRIAREHAAEEREKTKRQALDKLTVAERKALGVY